MNNQKFNDTLMNAVMTTFILFLVIIINMIISSIISLLLSFAFSNFKDLFFYVNFVIIVVQALVILISYLSTLFDKKNKKEQ